MKKTLLYLLFVLTSYSIPNSAFTEVIETTNQCPISNKNKSVTTIAENAIPDKILNSTTENMKNLSERMKNLHKSVNKFFLSLDAASLLVWGFFILWSMKKKDSGLGVLSSIMGTIALNNFIESNLKCKNKQHKKFWYYKDITITGVSFISIFLSPVITNMFYAITLIPFMTYVSIRSAYNILHSSWHLNMQKNYLK